MNGTTLWQKQGTTERGELNETVDHITSMPSQIRRASLQAKPDPDGYSKRQLLSWKRKRNQNRLPHHALRSSTPWPLPIAPVTLELWQCCSHAHAITSPRKDRCLHVRIICLSRWVGNTSKTASLMN